MERLVHFTLLGQDFSFYTDAPEQEVNKIIDLVRNELESDDHDGRSAVYSNKMLVLGCLRIAARCVQLEEEFEGFKNQQGIFIDRLIDKVSTEMDL